jgi:hypothetical protein
VRLGLVRVWVAGVIGLSFGLEASTLLSPGLTVAREREELSEACGYSHRRVKLVLEILGDQYSHYEPSSYGQRVA